ncbi:MAG: glycosyltransferase [Bacteroidales bacterium]|nr:glycosyltransferase [Bacteroidales bacterium]
MGNRVLITCPYYREGAGGVATFYKVFAEKQTQNARLFFVGKDKPCGIVRTLVLLFCQFVKLFFVLPRYDLLVVNPSLMTNAIRRDTVSIRIARFWKKKTCVFWRGFDDDFFNNVARKEYKKKLQCGLFKVDYSIVLGKNTHEKYKSIGLNTPYSLGTTMLHSDLLRTSPKVFSQQSFTILFLARLIKGKGIFEALEAFKVFHHQHPECIFLIAGDGEEAYAVKQYIADNQLQHVEMLGDIRGEQKKACYESSDIYLFPSYTEGMPNSVLEAMGMGLPIITSTVGAIPDFFEDGKMGVLMTGHSTNDILDALKTLYHNRNHLPEISNYNRNYAANHFVDTIVVQNLEHIFNQI